MILIPLLIFLLACAAIYLGAIEAALMQPALQIGAFTGKQAPRTGNQPLDRLGLTDQA